MDYGDIVRLGVDCGRVSVHKVDVIEAVEAYVRAAFKTMPDKHPSWPHRRTDRVDVAEKGGLSDGSKTTLYHGGRRGNRPACSIVGKVVALADSGDPLFYCTGGNGAASQTGHVAFGVSLKNGEFHRFDHSDVIGVLKPELFPDSAKLQLSQIQPTSALPLELNEPTFIGYGFLPDGRYAAGVWLCSPQEVIEYVKMQKPYQHRILICDREDFDFILAKTGCCPMQTTLPLFFKWGITFDHEYVVEERATRKVAYADRFELKQEIVCRSDAYEDGFDELPRSRPREPEAAGCSFAPQRSPQAAHAARGIGG